MTDPETAVAVDQADQADQANDELTADDLVEEVSIDGMCGVY